MAKIPSKHLAIAWIAEILRFEASENFSDRELIYSAYKLYLLSQQGKLRTKDESAKTEQHYPIYDSKELDKVITPDSFESLYTEFDRMGLLNEDDGYEQKSYAPRSKTRRF